MAIKPTTTQGTSEVNRSWSNRVAAAPKGVQTFTLNKGFATQRVNVPSGIIILTEKKDKLSQNQKGAIHCSYSFQANPNISPKPSTEDRFTLYQVDLAPEGQKMFNSQLGNSIAIAEGKPLFILEKGTQPISDENFDTSVPHDQSETEQRAQSVSLARLQDRSGL